MVGDKMWLFPFVLVLVFSAVSAETAHSQRIENREANREGWIDHETKSAGSTLIEERRRAELAEQRAAANMEGVERQGRRQADKEGSRTGERTERRSADFSAPGALNNRSEQSK